MPTSLEDVRVLKVVEEVADAIYKTSSRWDEFAQVMWLENKLGVRLTRSGQMSPNCLDVITSARKFNFYIMLAVVSSRQSIGLIEQGQES